MLPVLALVALLLLPEDELPDLLFVGEPELGLYFNAIAIVGGLIGVLSTRVPVMIAAQSTSLLECSEPEEVVVVDRVVRRSVFGQLCSDDLGDWLDNYTLSELWEKNVIGGQL